MQKLSRASAGFVFIAFGSLFTFACGGDVEGSGGSGTSGSSTTSASVGGDPITANQACNDVCHQLETMNCNLGGGTDCMTQCTNQLQDLPPECEDEYVTEESCLLQNMSTCDYPAACELAQNGVGSCIAMYGCVSGPCSAGMGMNGEASCGCDATCKGTKYSTNCTTPAGGGMATCDCLVEGMSVGTCQMADPGACGPKDTCCNAMYFKL